MRILYSVPHGPLAKIPADGVSTPDGLTEAQNAYQIAAFIKPALKALGHECEVLTGSPLANWYHVQEVRKSEPWALSVEVHMNSFAGANARYGHLLEHHMGESHERDLCKRIAVNLVECMPWSNLIGIIEQPDPRYPAWAFLRNTSPPSVLLECGFVQDHNWCNWIPKPINQEKLAKCLAAAIDEWSHVEPIKAKTELSIETIPVGGLIDKKGR